MPISYLSPELSTLWNRPKRSITMASAWRTIKQERDKTTRTIDSIIARVTHTTMTGTALIVTQSCSQQARRNREQEAQKKQKLQQAGRGRGDAEERAAFQLQLSLLVFVAAASGGIGGWRSIRCLPCPFRYLLPNMPPLSTRILIHHCNAALQEELDAILEEHLGKLFLSASVVVLHQGE